MLPQALVGTHGGELMYIRPSVLNNIASINNHTGNNKTSPPPSPLPPSALPTSPPPSPPRSHKQSPGNYTTKEINNHTGKSHNQRNKQSRLNHTPYTASTDAVSSIKALGENCVASISLDNTIQVTRWSKQGTKQTNLETILGMLCRPCSV